MPAAVDGYFGVRSSNTRDCSVTDGTIGLDNQAVLDGIINSPEFSSGVASDWEVSAGDLTVGWKPGDVTVLVKLDAAVRASSDVVAVVEVAVGVDFKTTATWDDDCAKCCVGCNRQVC